MHGQIVGKRITRVLPIIKLFFVIFWIELNFMFFIAEAVVSALISRNSLKVLDLHGNYISIGACKRIAEAMRLRKEQKVTLPS